jgi:hypothetical protein
MKDFTRLYFTVFILLGILFIPFTWNLITFQLEFTQFFFSNFIQLISSITESNPILLDFSSDSKSLYLLLLSLVLTGFILAFIIHRLYKDEKKRHRFIENGKTIAVYYLAIVLMKYGFDKLFKAQFYLPEPNILYTPFGKLDKDILFWSTMGTSYSYNLFMGFMEILPGLFLLFKRTREIGLIISFGVLLNVFAINLSFDISVKLFSAFLLLINLYLLTPVFKMIWEIFILKKNTIKQEPLKSSSVNFRKIAGKFILFFLILAESLFPYFKSRNFNDDIQSRPFLHGAYEVQQIKINGKVIEKKESQLKRIFIHRDNYLILQDQNENMVDYKLKINEVTKKMTLTDYDSKISSIYYSFNKKDSLLLLNYKIGTNIMSVKTKMCEWKNLPIMKQQFHWTVD